MTTTPVKVDLFGDLYKNVLTYMNTSGKKETFDTEVIPEQGYNEMSKLVGVDVNVFKSFVKDLDQPIDNIPAETLRSTRLPVLESLRNKFITEIMPLVKKNMDNFTLPGNQGNNIEEIDLTSFGITRETSNQIRNQCEAKSNQKNVLNVIGSNVTKLTTSQKNAAKNICLLQVGLGITKDQEKETFTTNIINRMRSEFGLLGLSHSDGSSLGITGETDNKTLREATVGCIQSLDQENVINTVGAYPNQIINPLADCIGGSVSNIQITKGMNPVSNQQPQPLVQLIKDNVDSFGIFIVRIIDMAIEHTNDRIKYGKPTNREYFTVSLITSNIPEKGRRVMSLIMERYGMKFDDFIQVINKFELKASDLTEEERKHRLRVLLILRQLADVFNTVVFRSFIDHKSFLDDDENSQKSINNQIKLLDLMKYIVEYIIDLHIREIYNNLLPIEKRKIGFHFEKFAPSFPNYLVEVKSRELVQVREQINSCYNQNEENGKTRRQIEQMLIGAIVVVILLCIVMSVMYLRGGSNDTPMPMSMPVYSQQMGYR